MENQSDSNGTPSLPVNARGHKLTCQCRVCLAIQNARAKGIPTKAQRAADAQARRIARAKAKVEAKIRRELERKLVVEQHRRVVQTSLESQALSGAKPSMELAAKQAGISAPTAAKLAGEDFVQTALSKHGITDDRLASVASEGLDATLQRIVTDRNGEIIDVVNVPDWKSRHAFWADLLKVKKILGSDADTSQHGGLVIITPNAARVVEGHPATCTCDTCIAAWQSKARELQRLAMRETAIELTPTALPPTTTNSGADEDEDYSDREV